MRCKALIMVGLLVCVSSSPLSVAASDAAVRGTQGEPVAAETEAEAEARKKAAQQYFKRGTRLFDTGEYARAAELFVLAYKEAPHPVGASQSGVYCQIGHGCGSPLNGNIHHVIAIIREFKPYPIVIDVFLLDLQ